MKKDIDLDLAVIKITGYILCAALYVWALAH